MSLSGLQSSWSPAFNGGGGGGGGSSITNGTAPNVGTVSVGAGGVVAVSSTNAEEVGAGSIFLETSLVNSVVISPTLGDETTVAGPVLFSAAVYNGAASYGVGSIVEDGVLGDYYVATAPNLVGAPAPGADGANWALLASPSTISHTDVAGGEAIVTTLLGNVTATAAGDAVIIAAGSAQLTATNSVSISGSTGDVSIAASSSSAPGAAGQYVRLTAGNSANTGEHTRIFMTATAGAPDPTDIGLYVTPTGLYFNGALIA